MCEKFHLDNDYKLSQIRSFWNDHVAKHIRAYEACKVAASQQEGALQKE